MDLDDCGQIARLDRSDLMKKLEELQLQFRRTPSLFKEANWNPATAGAVQRVIFCGMGGSAIGGDIVRAQLGSRLRVPFEVNRDYRVHGLLDRRSLVILSSYSGNTEETLSCLKQALAGDSPIVAITSGGKLGARCERLNIPVFRVPGGAPPRSVLGYPCALTMQILDGVGVAPLPDLEKLADSLAGWAEPLLPGSPTSANPAKQIAVRLHGRIGVIYGSAGRLSPVARRWATQLAENGKQLAFFSELPEMNHNEIVGWQHPAEVLPHFYPIFLRDGSDDPPIRRRFQLTAEALSSKAGQWEEVWAQGEDRPGRLWFLIQLGDFVSAYCGFLNMEDPTPVEAIERFKKAIIQTEETP